MSGQFILMELLEELIHLCNERNILFWLDWGSLLGQVRHNNIIPWDNDCDICMLEGDYLLLLDYFDLSSNRIGKLVCEPDAYNDYGCFWIRHRDYIDTDYGIDVVKYTVQEEPPYKVCNLMNETTLTKWPPKPPQTYDFEQSELFPLKRVYMLGNYVRVPNRAVSILERGYGEYLRYEPVQLYDEWSKGCNQNHLQSPFKVIKECQTIAEGLLLNEPFIVRNCSEFKHVDQNKLREYFCSENSVLSWYETETELFNEKYEEGSKLYQQWVNNSLQYNIVDSPNSHLELLPDILLRNKDNLDPDSSVYAICYALTKRNNLTKYHIDPLGDGWVYLTCGRKIWHIIADTDMEYLASHNVTLESIKNLNFTELVHILDSYLWGKIYVTEMGPSDFIYFPQNWAHRVVTYDKSLGVSGYTSKRLSV